MEETVENWQKHSRRYLSYKKYMLRPISSVGFNTIRWIGPISIKTLSLGKQDKSKIRNRNHFINLRTDPQPDNFQDHIQIRI